MKITKAQLKQIIKEELETALLEAHPDYRSSRASARTTWQALEKLGFVASNDVFPPSEHSSGGDPKLGSPGSPGTNNGVVKVWPRNGKGKAWEMQVGVQAEEEWDKNLRNDPYNSVGGEQV